VRQLTNARMTRRRAGVTAPSRNSASPKELTTSATSYVARGMERSDQVGSGSRPMAFVALSSSRRDTCV
jgi:hypothetical protein